MLDAEDERVVGRSHRCVFLTLSNQERALLKVMHFGTAVEELDHLAAVSISQLLEPVMALYS